VKNCRRLRAERELRTAEDCGEGKKYGRCHREQLAPAAGKVPENPCKLLSLAGGKSP
jgi:hypothetical protein